MWQILPKTPLDLRAPAEISWTRGWVHAVIVQVKHTVGGEWDCFSSGLVNFSSVNPFQGEL